MYSPVSGRRLRNRDGRRVHVDRSDVHPRMFVQRRIGDNSPTFRVGPFLMLWTAPTPASQCAKSRLLFRHCECPSLHISDVVHPSPPCPLLGVKRTSRTLFLTSAFDAVDGSRPTASQCAKVVVSMNHRETGAIHERSYHD